MLAVSGIRDIKRVSADVWDDMFNRSHRATFFQSRLWAEIWRDYSQGRLHLAAELLQFDDGTEVVLPMVLETSCKGLVHTYHLSANGTFGGWLTKGTLDTEQVEQIVDHVRDNIPNLVWLTNPYDSAADLIDLPVLREIETHMLDLRNGFDALYEMWSKGGWKKGCSASARTAYKVRKARRDGVTVRQAESEADWRAYYEIYQDSLRRWGRRTTSSYDWRLFDLLRRRQGSDIRLWLGQYEGEIIVGEICLYAQRHVVTWHGAALEKYFKLHPRNLLIFEMIKDACARGFWWFDFNPSGGHEGVRKFKESFGAQSRRCRVLGYESTRTQLLGWLGRAWHGIVNSPN